MTKNKHEDKEPKNKNEEKSSKNIEKEQKNKIKQLEEHLLQECEIPLSQIEPKYYSQMLEGSSVKKVQDSGRLPAAT